MTIRWSALLTKIQKSNQQRKQPTWPQVSTWSAPPINASSLHYPYLDRIAVVSEEIAQGQSGQVYLDNTWWRARCRQPLELPVGRAVIVRGRDRLTLWVEPISTD
jgi:membrane protein implicated in regulation of membrane protease activity